MSSHGEINLIDKIAIKGNKTIQIHWYENIKTGQKVEHKLKAEIKPNLKRLE